MIKSLLMATILTLPVLAQARDLDVIYKNNQGVKQFKKEKFLESYEDFLSLTAEAPYDSQLLFNLGASLTANGEEEKAEPLYKQLLKTVDQKIQSTKDEEERKELIRVRYAILYNLGVHYQSIKEVDKALEYYQQGLEMSPESKEIKTNIEMMFAGGEGQGKGDPNKDQKGDGEGQGDQQQQDSGGEQDKKDKPSQGDKKDDKNKEQKKGPQEFDQKQMSMEDLKRIMEELKQQEQNIRAKVQKKGGKDGVKEKQW